MTGVRRPRLVDLFSCGGGAGAGYARAGFDVLGVDIHPQPHYPFGFIQDDALELLDAIIRAPSAYGDFDVIHASPPCQAKTSMSNRHRGQGGKADSHLDLIRPTWERLRGLRVPWIIENVPGASLDIPEAHKIVLHGGMFGLGVYRPRVFWSNVLLWSHDPAPPPPNPIGVYGKLDGRRLWTRGDGTELRCARTLDEAQRAMGIDWLPWEALTEAIPPAYTEWIGRQLLNHVGLEAA